MKLVKPTALSFTCRPLLLLGRQRLTVTSLVGFSLADGAAGAPRLVPEIALWPAIAEVTGGLVDEGLPKPRGEVLVYGSCHTPNGKPLPVSYVRVQLGAVDKKLAIIGDRYWRETAWKDPCTEPAPFTEMPLGWDRAFGGPDYAKNPLGRGIAGEGGRVALPNVEHARGLITSPSQRPEPAGFGPLDVAWPQRTGLAGTYDGRWLEEGFPGFARDTDSAFFSTASADQRIVGFFRGDESFVLENLHPTRARIAGTLPRVAARTFVRARARGREFESVTMRLDSVVLLPEKEIGILVFRGTVDVEEDDAADVTHVLAACEDLAAPRDVAHYRKALESRLDKDQSPFLALQEDDMLPAFAKGTGLEALLKGATSKVDAGGDAIKKKVEAQVRAQLEAQGLDADETLAKAKAQPKPPGLEGLSALGKGPDLSAPGGFAAFEKAVNEALAAATTYAEATKEKLLAGARKEVGELPPSPPPQAGPPAPQAPRILASLAEANTPVDAATTAKLHDADAQMLAAYRETAHFMDAATGVDLSGRTMRGENHRDALLAGANLTKTDLSKADLAGALLAHATLRGTRFDGATLEGANLGASIVDGACFDGANLKKATLARAKLVAASFKGADLTDVDLLEAELGALDFEGAIASGISFLPGLDLTKCRFSKAILSKANFLETKLDGVDFAEAILELVTFLKVSANGASFRGANLRGFHAVAGCSLRDANFDGANLDGAFLRGADLRGATFVGASLKGTDLSECDLTGANLSRVRAREVMLVRANLTGASLRDADFMDAMLQKSTLDGADMSGASLFAANLGQVRLDTATKNKGANLKRALLHPKLGARS
jgi:uncharacterized protein YjbI with pentapeptide repeats